MKLATISSFNRRGDSLGGAACAISLAESKVVLFQSQGRFFGGCCRASRLIAAVALVSIAGAILWGVLRPVNSGFGPFSLSFNRRGDSLGGAALDANKRMILFACFNRRGDSLGGAASLANPSISFWVVSIAGAILWGVLLKKSGDAIDSLLFQSQGRFFGGCCLPKQLY